MSDGLHPAPLPEGLGIAAAHQRVACPRCILPLQHTLRPSCYRQQQTAERRGKAAGRAGQQGVAPDAGEQGTGLCETPVPCSPALHRCILAATRGGSHPARASCHLEAAAAHQVSAVAMTRLAEQALALDRTLDELTRHRRQERR